MLDSTINLKNGPVLIFGGPYSNFQATEAMRGEAEQLNIPRHNIICTGDLVAYCGNPEETVNLVRDWGIHVVMGNCEESIGNRLEDCSCGFDVDSLCSTLSIEWFEYASTKVSPSNRNWMKSLPRKIFFNIGETRFAIIHGGVDNISEFVFASSDTTKKLRDIESIDADCIVGGHCGLPFGQNIDNHYWLNSGVIGMPANDGTRDGWYLLLDQENSGITARWHRLSFDVGIAANSMQDAGLGKDYRDALVSGIWPSADILPSVEKSVQGKYLELAPMLVSG